MARSIFWVENDAAYFFHDVDNFSQEGVVGAGLRGGRFFTSAEVPRRYIATANGGIVFRHHLLIGGCTLIAREPNHKA